MVTAALGSSMAAFLIVACSRPPSDEAPMNVILLLVDTLRADHVGCYGYSRDTSPNLDAFAENSVRFASVTSQAPWTNPSVATLLTSLYPTTHHLTTLKEDGKLRKLADSATTLAEHLAENGYATAAFTSNPWISRATGLDQGFGVFENLPVSDRGESVPAPLLNEKALAWLETVDPEQPFFLFVHYMDVHGPYRPPEPYRSLFETERGQERLLTEAEQRRLPRYLRIPDAETLDVYVDRYDGQIRFWDDEFATFMERIGGRDLLDNTMIVVTSDHGEEFLERGGFNHGATLFQEQISVPLIWKFPRDRVPTSVVTEQVELIDVMPTLLALVGIEPTGDLQGDDLRPLLEGDSWQQRPAFSEAAVKGGGVPRPKGVLKSVRLDDIKTIVNLTTDEALAYDLSTNPGEKRQLARSAALPTEPGRSAIDAWFELNSSLGARFLSTTSDHDPSLVEQLEALGYVED
jgi:arylsulfatase